MTDLERRMDKLEDLAGINAGENDCPVCGNSRRLHQEPMIGAGQQLAPSVQRCPACGFIIHDGREPVPPKPTPAGLRPGQRVLDVVFPETVPEDDDGDG